MPRAGTSSGKRPTHPSAGGGGPTKNLLSAHTKRPNHRQIIDRKKSNGLQATVAAQESAREGLQRPRPPTSGMRARKRLLRLEAAEEAPSAKKGKQGTESTGTPKQKGGNGFLLRQRAHKGRPQKFNEQPATVLFREKKLSLTATKPGTRAVSNGSTTTSEEAKGTRGKAPRGSS